MAEYRVIAVKYWTQASFTDKGAFTNEAKTFDGIATSRSVLHAVVDSFIDRNWDRITIHRREKNHEKPMEYEQENAIQAKL